MPHRDTAPHAVADAATQIVFVIGTGRCGSTIVQEMLARHPGVAFVSNVDEYLSPVNPKGRWNELLYRLAPVEISKRDRVGSGLIQQRLHFGPSEAYRLLARRVSPLVSMSFRDLRADDVTPWLAARFQRFADERLMAQGKGVFLHKLTGWPRAAFLHAIFPEARFVHMIRDGRAVAASLMQRPWWHGHLGPEGWGFGPLAEPYQREWEESGRSFVALAGIEWKVLMDAFDVARRAVPEDRWLQLRYEDFVDDPRKHTAAILDWVGLPWTDRFERSFARYSYSSARKDAFRRELAPQQADLLDGMLREHLKRLGYAAGAAGTSQAER